MAIKLKAPENVSSASVGGQEFAVKRGFVTVPEEAIASLLELGFKELTNADPEPVQAEQ